MKAKYSVIILISFIVFTSLFTSCGKDRWEEYYPFTRHSLWIDSVMRANYLWNDELQDEDELTSSYFLNSVAFLSKVRNSDDYVSYIDTTCSQPIIGHGYQLAIAQVNDTALMAVITYIEPTSVAATAGLQRGEWIMAVDNEAITSKTQGLLTDGEAHKLMIGHSATIVINDEETAEEAEHSIVVFNRMVNLPEASGYFPNDLPVISIINNRVGYLLYNNIAEANQQKVAAASKSLSAGNIINIVLDLRHAATGDVKGLQYLASILAPSSVLGNQLATVQFAESRHMESSLPFLTASELGEGINLNLNKLYVLTSSATSGPAEMLINCLESVMEVIVIGQQTKGIGVACETFSDPVNDQLLHLAACHVTDINNKADYIGVGIEPDYSIDPLSTIEGIQPFGSEYENLLAKALKLINN